jgi:adenylate cyclase
MTLPAPEPADIERLEAYLRSLGATDDDLVDARAAHSHGALALELVLRAGSEPIGLAEAAARLGATSEEVARFWQALGFADPPNRKLSARFVEAQTVISHAATEWLGEETALGIARVIGASAARLAETIVDAYRMAFEVPELTAGANYSDVVEGYVGITRDTLPSFEAFVSEVFEAHLVRVAASAWMPGEDAATTSRDLAIGFVDLVGYTSLSRTLGGRDLAGLLSRFEDTVGDVLARHGGRPVKTIGDGVMFAADSAATGCAAASALADAFATAAGLPPVRVGLACGPVLSLYGDYFGDVVNRAARLVALADPATVVVSETVASGAGPAYVFERLPAQAVKGFQTPVRPFRLLGPAG